MNGCPERTGSDVSENPVHDTRCVSPVLPTNRTVVEFYKKNGYKIEDRISMGKEIRENVP